MAQAQQQFEHREFDVTSTCEKILCCASRILVLEPEEAVVRASTCIDKSEKRLPYGELGSVEQVNACGCCASFNSNLGEVDENGTKQPIAPGCGCSGELVSDIVTELKARMKSRGDTGNILRAEEALRFMQSLSLKVDSLIQHLGIAAPPAPEPPKTLPTAFDHKDYDVTTCCHKFCYCGSKTLNLEPEEAQLITTTLCTRSTSRRPYGELGNVDANECCFCCVSSGSSLGLLSPGWGCDKATVDDITEELRKRMRARGDTGNIQRQEDALLLARAQEPKIVEMCKKTGVPSEAQAPLMQTMQGAGPA
jgi:hypothetical protein